jgi:hypothetical protein
VNLLISLGHLLNWSEDFQYLQLAENGPSEPSGSMSMTGMITGLNRNFGIFPQYFIYELFFAGMDAEILMRPDGTPG